MEPWGIQIQSLSWFSSGADQVSAADLFAAITGEQPENSQTNRVPSPVAPFLSIAQGLAKSDCHLTVQVQPGRIDAQIGRPDVEGRPASWSHQVGTKYLDWLAGKATDAKVANVAARLALNVKLMVGMPSAEAANAYLLDRIGFAAPPTHALDLNTQVNLRRASSTVPGVEFNRLMRFHPSFLQEMAFAVPGANVQITTPFQALTGVELHFANMDLDLNTVPTGREFSKDEQALLMTELAAEAARLAANGNLSGLIVQ